MAIRPGILAGTLIALLACEAEGPSVHIAWTGSDTGAAALAATAIRCGAGPLTVLAVSGDTGVSIALYARGDVEPGTYPVTASAAGAAPPAAAVGARWLDSADVAGYRAGSGTVTLTAGGPELEGTFTVQATRPDQARPVTLTGRFRGIPVEPCPADSVGPGV